MTGCIIIKLRRCVECGKERVAVTLDVINSEEIWECGFCRARYIIDDWGQLTRVSDIPE
jgi:transcription elongation factor Elf1